ncbi:hypothetical protein DSO57_1022660 [Entomophthora muscae]|uniref:Uncharacterized protein n=1 Tax=Entomophthora muscae TaxID=34485 RepID=A0ACC2U1F9_9FUNG|nr:hypothetical protein DSO57_1022660 [Entomophthora muscae]
MSSKKSTKSSPKSSPPKSPLLAKTASPSNANVAIKVAVRVRPSKKEPNGLASANFEPAVETSMHNNTLYLPFAGLRAGFDFVLDSTVSQMELYQKCVRNMVTSFLEGFNMTILAYGQTSSGKTYTMGTSGSCDPDSEGVVPRAVQTIFEEISVPGFIGKDVKVSVSYLEIYNDDMIDLLCEDPKSGRTINVKQDHHGKIIWEGIKEVPVQSPTDVKRLLAQGTKRRQTAATDMNAVSSRSHAIFSVNLTQTRVGSKSTKSIIHSKCHFVDLAGSERLKKTGAIGNRAKEGININSELSSLGKVINALADPANNPFVPYRESKLTRLLQDSLGGNSCTMMIACLSPDKADRSETQDTVRYASTARKITNRLKQDKEDITDVRALMNQVKQLTEELTFLKANANDVSGMAPPSTDVNETILFLIKHAQSLEKDLHNVKDKYSVLQKQLVSRQHRPSSSLSRRESSSHAFDDNASVAISELSLSTTTGLSRVLPPVVEEYELACQRLHNANLELQKTNLDLHSQVKAQIAKASILTNKNDAYKQEVESLQEQLQELLTESIQLHECIANIKAKSDLQIETLEKENVHLKEQLQKENDWQGRLSEAEAKFAESESRRLELEAQLSALKNAESEMSSSVLVHTEDENLDESFRELQELESVAAQMEKKLSPHLQHKALSKDTSPDVTPSFQLEKELEAKNSQLNTLEAKLLELESQNKTYSGEAAQLRESCDALTHQVHDMLAADADSKQVISKLQTDLESLNQQLLAASGSHDLQQASLSAQNSLVEDLNRRVAELTLSCQDMDQVKSKLGRVEEEHQATLQQLETSVNQLASEQALSKQLEEKMAELTASLKNTEESLASARREIREQNDLLNLQVEQTKALKEDNTRLTESYQDAQRKLCMSPPPTTTVVADDLSAVKVQKERLEKQLSMAKVDLKNATVHVDALEKEIVVIEAQREEAVKQSKSLRAESESNATSIQQLEKERALLSERLSALQKEHDLILERNSRYAHQAKLASPTTKDDEANSQTSGSRRSKSKFICI